MIEDDWTDGARARATMPFEWKGHATFFDKCNVDHAARPGISPAKSTTATSGTSAGSASSGPCPAGVGKTLPPDDTAARGRVGGAGFRAPSPEEYLPAVGPDGIQVCKDMQSVIELIEEEARTAFNRVDVFTKVRNRNPTPTDHDTTAQRGKQWREGIWNPTTVAAIHAVHELCGDGAAKARGRPCGQCSGEGNESGESVGCKGYKAAVGNEERDFTGQDKNCGHFVDGNVTWVDMSEAEMDWRVVDFTNGGAKGAGIVRPAENISVCS